MAIEFWSPDFIIIVSYLSIILFVGISVGRNIHSLKEFAISKKDFSTPTIIATMFATAVGGGSTIGVSEKAFSVGIIYALPLAGNVIGQITYAYIILFSKIFNHNKSISVGELVGKLYGNIGRVITGVLAVCVSLGYVSAQISSIGYIFNYFFDIPFFWGVILGYGIVITYTTFGGIRSVVFTDVIQFGVMIVAVPLLFNVSISQIGGISNLINSVPVDNLSFISDKMNLTQLIILCVTFSFVGFNPSFIQRLLIVKDNKQAFQSVFFSAVLTIPFFILVIGIGLVALSMDHSINPNFAFSYLVDHILPVGLKGLLIAGLLSAIMSTADSDLNIIGISAINDIVIPLRKKKLSDSQAVLLARIVTFTFGIISIFIPLYFKNVIDIILFFTNFWAPTILVPLIMIMFGKKIDLNAFLTCLVCGVLAMLLYNYYTDDKYGAGAVIGVFANLAAFTISYMSTKKKIIKIY